MISVKYKNIFSQIIGVTVSPLSCSLLTSINSLMIRIHHARSTLHVQTCKQDTIKN